MLFADGLRAGPVLLVGGVTAGLVFLSGVATRAALTTTFESQWPFLPMRPPQVIRRSWAPIAGA
ncbi:MULTISPECIES: hypothetical protein [Streptomyces]|uniref:hypothetical protein n=1 Tax=Streptomyces TaxID=1883 RepID=UPI001683BCCC|nr:MULTISPECIES: hypothetical protein [Streptomyces]